jgi:hypothetical protein
MSALTEATPAYFDAYEVRFGDNKRVGGHISVVYPPDRTRSWRVVKFEVVLKDYPPVVEVKTGTHRAGTPTRMYRPCAERPLTDEEITHFAALMATWVKPVYPPIGD